MFKHNAQYEAGVHDMFSSYMQIATCCEKSNILPCFWGSDTKKGKTISV